MEHYTIAADSSEKDCQIFNSKKFFPRRVAEVNRVVDSPMSTYLSVASK